MRITASETFKNQLRLPVGMTTDPMLCPTRRCRRARRCIGALSTAGYLRCDSFGGDPAAGGADGFGATWTWPEEPTSLPPTDDPDPAGARK